MAQIGFADFIIILNVHDPLDWVPGLEVRTDGIWVVQPVLMTIALQKKGP